MTYDEYLKLTPLLACSQPLTQEHDELRFVIIHQTTELCLKTVERIIGFKRGTGGTEGAAYLARARSGSFFPELFSLRTEM